MTDLERARKVLELIRKSEHATVEILVLVRKGLGEFTFSPTLE